MSPISVTQDELWMSYWASWIIQQIQFFFVQLGGFHRVCVQHPDNVYPLVDPWQCLRCWNALCYVSCILKCSCDCQCLCTDVWSPTMSFLVFYPCTARYECKAIVLQSCGRSRQQVNGKSIMFKSLTRSRGQIIGNSQAAFFCFAIHGLPPWNIGTFHQTISSPLLEYRVDPRRDSSTPNCKMMQIVSFA